MSTAIESVIDDPGAFGERLLGRPLWDHQCQVARSKARYRVVCAGRQVGKSTGVAVIALHAAATHRNYLVLLVSAGEEASKRLLAECASLMSRSDLLRGGVVDESKSSITLSNGSRILSVPASERQIRGWPVDLLIVDEAGFVPMDVWQAAEPAIIARPGSRVILLSSPWGGMEHFFRQLWQRGMDRPDEQVESWHWPSSVSPLVDRVLLEQIRERNTPEYFAREFLAEWTDEAGAYFTEAEIEACVADYAMTAPEDLAQFFETPYGFPAPAVAGIDWGMARDANAVVLLSLLEDHFLSGRRELSLFVPWLEARHGWAYTDFIERVVQIGSRYHLRVIASEVNGVGQYPTQDLQRRIGEAGHLTAVSPVVTDVRRKQSGFGKLKGLMQRHRIVLPRHPELLKQLRGLTFEQLPSGNVRLSVPEAVGHDDIAMALMQAVTCVSLDGAVRDGDWWDRASDGPFAGETVTTGAGLRLPARPSPVAGQTSAFHWPQGAERGELY